MAETSAISWTRHTWSPWTGCARISPACDGCYAAHLMDHRFGRAEWGGPGEGEGTRALLSVNHWKKPIAWNRKPVEGPVPPFVFPSLCDPFDTAVPDAWRSMFVDLMERTPNLIWLLLTKRIGNAVKLTDPERGYRPLPPNHAIGATFANQAEWERDRFKLWDARWRLGSLFSFGSFEPLLGEIRFDGMWFPEWVIAGGESTQGNHLARPSHPDWFRGLRDQCAALDIPFHFKQWGSCLPASWDGDTYWIDRSHFDGDPESLGRGTHARLGSREFVRFHHARTGRLLDGKEHLAFPKYEGARHACA